MKLFRIIPATMAVATVFLAVKVVDVARGTEAIAEQAGESAPSAPAPTPAPAPAAAETAAPAPTETAAKPEAAAPAEPAKTENTPAAAEKKPESAGAKPAEAKTETAKPDAKSEAKPEAKKEEGGGDKEKKPEAKSEGKPEGKSDEKKNPAVSEGPGALTDRHFSAVELNLLQNLAHRREDLDRWERNIQIKEAMLDATEKRINDKIQQIEAMRQEVSALLAQYNEKEDAKIRSLVKVYEAMKPKDAARIFNEMDMPVVLLIIDRMSEKKSALILAEMDSHKAKQITVDLAEKHKFNTAKLNVPAPAPAASPTAQQ